MPKKKRDGDENDETLVVPAINAPDGKVEVPADKAEPASPGAGASEPPPQPELGAELVIEWAPRVALVEVNGPGDGRVTPISRGTCLIGRFSPDLNLRLTHDHRVSRAHARVNYREGMWVLEDLNSSNGTWIENGRTRVTQPVTIVPGQVFRVGHSDLMLSDDPELIRSHSELL